jgi:opacity protein-like surface antigen
MKKLLAGIGLTMALAAPALAEDLPNASTSSGDGATARMADLLKDGYEIKAAVPNGKKFIVFLQKDTTAYVCEFSSLNNSRCGAIN